MAEDAAGEGVVWLEPAPSLRAGRAAQLGLRRQESVLELLLDAAREAEQATGAEIGFLVTANRTRP